MESIVHTLQQAIETGEILFIIYHGGSEPGTVRMIAPLRIDTHSVLARCIKSKKIRSFSFDKIELTDATKITYTGLAALYDAFCAEHPRLFILPPLQKLSVSDLKALARDFEVPKRKSNYHLPRIAFFGMFKYLSMTDYRHVCQQLGFEYIEDIPFGTTNEEQMAMLTGKWRYITDFTCLVVIGEEWDEDIFSGLYRRYNPKKDKIPRQPILFERRIPVMMESELIKIHPDYPNITLSTSWKAIL